MERAGSVSNAIEVKGLKKVFGHQFALRGLELDVPSGEFLTILGPNGAGKTTLIRVLAHLVKPSEGDVRLLGVPLNDLGSDIRRQIGVISHQTFLYQNLTGRENLKFYGKLFGVVRLGERIDAVLQEVDLADRADSLVRTYSKGMSQRLAIARAILHDPRVILLDEPYTGLDQHAAAILSGMLRRLRDGRRTLVMTTHNLEQGLELSHRIAIQVAGRMVFDVSSQGLSRDALARLYFEQLEAAEARRGGGRRL